MNKEHINMTDNQQQLSDITMDHIDSPCIGACTLNHLQICNGCFRSLGEITSWATDDTDQRRQILENIANRQQFSVEG